MTRADLQFHAVFGDGAERGLSAALGVGAVDHLGVDAGPHRVDHIAPGQIDGGRAVKVQIDAGAVSGDDGVNHTHHVAAGQVMRLEPGGGHAGLPADVQARLRRHDLGLDDDSGIHLTETHADQADDRHVRPRHEGLEPELPVDKKDNRHDHHGHDQGGHDHQIPGVDLDGAFHREHPHPPLGHRMTP